jgi:lysophospholipase L1-like esterase
MALRPPGGTDAGIIAAHPGPGNYTFTPCERPTNLLFGSPSFGDRAVYRSSTLIALALTFGVVPAAADDPPLAGVSRVVFLGDSITSSGQYVEDIEAVLRVRHPALRCEFLDLGLPSETASGLTEPGHAGGQFPRPDLHERLDRVLKMTRPGLVVACYGMNDGIYHPFDEGRFRKFQEGMRYLHDRAVAAGARVLHVTPPVFDPDPIRANTLPEGLAEYRKPFEGYDGVLGRYSEWLLARRADGWDVVDVHGPMKRYLVTERGRDPKFRLAADGVHINPTGHWLIAREVLAHWGVPARELATAATVEQVLSGHRHGAEVLALVRKKQRLLKDAWLTATGHRRPGMARWLPLAEAERKANELDAEVRRLVEAAP